MYNEKEMIITAIIEYDYDLDKIKEIIKEITDLKGLKKLEVNNEYRRF